jgi:hypothetical protein
MATSEDVDHFLTDHAPSLQASLQQESKDQLFGLIENYEYYGYSKEQLAEVLTEKVPPSTLDEASEEEFTKAVADLSAPAQSEPGTDQSSEPAAEVSGDAMVEDLAVALAADVNTEIEEQKAALFKHLTEQLWEQVRAEVMAEVEESETVWDSVEEAKAAAFEPAYNAMMAAVDGLWEAGEEDGGFATLLSRPQS